MSGKDNFLDDDTPIPVPRDNASHILSYDVGEGRFVNSTDEAAAVISKKQFMFTFYSLLAPPLLITIVSVIHMYDLFLIGNSPALAAVQAIGFEVLNASSVVAIGQMRMFSAVTRAIIWVVIFTLTVFMAIGNVFSVYINLDPDHLSMFSEMVSMSGGYSPKIIVSGVLGAILPFVSLFFLKILSNYWYKVKEIEKNA